MWSARQSVVGIKSKGRRGLRKGGERPPKVPRTPVSQVACDLQVWKKTFGFGRSTQTHRGNVLGSFPVFLASFGTLSAIRYFRRQVREGQSRT